MRRGKLGRLMLKGGLVVLLVVAAVQLWFLVQVAWYGYFNPSTTAFMQAGLARLKEKDPTAELKQRWVPYERISIHLKRAVIAAEDSRFLTHEGFDWEGIESAVEKNLKKGRIVAGGSTISQQLAKNLFLSATRNPVRKLQEAAITLMLEGLWSKRRILEVYLNVVEWGEGIYGAEAAARNYFGIPAARLTPKQAAQLAAMLPNPRYYQRHRQARGLLKRQAIIERRMGQVAVPR